MRAAARSRPIWLATAYDLFLGTVLAWTVAVVALRTGTNLDLDACALVAMVACSCIALPGFFWIRRARRTLVGVFLVDDALVDVGLFVTRPYPMNAVVGLEAQAEGVLGFSWTNLSVRLGPRRGFTVHLLDHAEKIVQAFDSMRSGGGR